MLSIHLGDKNLNNRYVQGLVQKNALMYLLLCEKDEHYRKMERYLRENYNLSSNLYSICYYIIARAKVTRDHKRYNVIISPHDEFLYRLITYGNLEVKGVPILNNALTTLK